MCCLQKKGTMNILQSSPHEHLRSMVGINGWDYCVFWKLGEDQRCLEWFGCCCCGAEIIESGAEQLSGVSPSCRDVLFPHPRTKTCDILTELPISLQLNSGIHAQVFLSSEPRWINFSDLTASEESSKTRVLIPSMCGGGLVELFISKHVSEDPQLMQFVSAQFHNFSFSPTQQEFTASPNMNEGIVREASTNLENSNFHQQENPLSSSSPPFLPKNNNLNLFQPWISEPENIPWDMSVDQIQHSNSPLIFIGQQFPPSNKHDIFLKDSADSAIYDKPSLNTIEYGGKLSKELPNDKGSIKQEMGRTESVSDCSDQQENEDDHKVVGRSGRKPQSKNLFAERKRRKKLKERLYALRALVPKITKMDRASILGDAIEYLKELQKQVKQFQDELEENLDEEGDKQVPTLLTQNGVYQKDNNDDDQGTRCSSTTKTSGLLKQNNETISIDDKSQQMEVQVEVNQGDGNEFNLKIFCEEKAGGFVRLMLAMDVLGLEVIHVNITNFRGFVLNVFKAEIRDNETIQPELVRDSLLELTKNPNGWSHAVRVGKNGSPDCPHNNNHRHLHHLNHH